jgi:hypothetical protein
MDTRVRTPQPLANENDQEQQHKKRRVSRPRTSTKNAFLVRELVSTVTVTGRSDPGVHHQFQVVAVHVVVLKAQSAARLQQTALGYASETRGARSGLGRLPLATRPNQRSVAPLVDGVLTLVGWSTG